MAYEELLRNIENDKFSEGERLVIDDLARKFGTSLIPIREALARLNAQHLVEYEKNKGYRVSPKPQLEDYRALFEARLIIEYSAIKFAGELVTDAHIRELRKINDRIEKLHLGTTYETFKDFVILNDKFHQILVSICGNDLIEQAYKGLAYGVQVSRGLIGRGVTDLKENVQEHSLIIAALAANDIQAAKLAVKNHILRGSERFTSHLRSGDSIEL